ncbi:MAG TPA: hypothetical protein VJO53_14895 [Candidatus Acidoferrales bacterium]|nr:hypothetical protein [Candidatus Acidoferrales bacterium]
MRKLRGAAAACMLLASVIFLSGLRSDGASSTAATVSRSSAGEGAGDPWTADQTVAPAELVKELGDANVAIRPVVACVGFQFLYEGGHVPGSSFHGPGSTDAGLTDVKKWAEGLPRSANVVLYCGCCPLERCPNLRPAFSAVREMGFKRLRVLILPQNFGTDWVAKGYPTEKGK